MATHYWEGDTSNRVVFVFSTPGRIEAENGRPVSGTTGANMDAILAELNMLRPDLFPRRDRYYYRITNASRSVMYAAKNDGKTEANNRHITAAQNMHRVLKEIGDCPIVILCGKKAQLLQEVIAGKWVVSCCHFGSKGLRNHFPNHCQEMVGLSVQERERKRRSLCAARIAEDLNRLTQSRLAAPSRTPKPHGTTGA